MIANVLVYLDENEFEYMDGTIRCGHIVVEDDSGRETMRQDLFDSAGYRTVSDLVDDVAGILRVHRDSVLVAA